MHGTSKGFKVVSSDNPLTIVSSEDDTSDVEAFLPPCKKKYIPPPESR